jgi:hypothetical protein
VISAVVKEIGRLHSPRIDGLTPGLSATGKPGNLKNTACGYAASRISSNLKGRTKHFGWLRASATKAPSFRNFRERYKQPNFVVFVVVNLELRRACVLWLTGERQRHKIS